MAVVLVVGAGRIGLPVAANLVRAGHEVQVIDVRPEVGDDVVSAGALWRGATVDRVHRDEVLMTVLPGSPELRRLMLGGSPGERGLLERMDPGSTWVDLTSAAPDLGAELALAAQQRGVRYLDAALGGGADAAQQASLAVYVGGDTALVGQQRGLLESIAAPDRIHHMGGHGAGYLTKLLINLLWFGQAVAVGEALLLGGSAGLDTAALAQVLPTSAAASTFVADHVPDLLAGNYLPVFGLDRCVEELDSLERLAGDTGTPFGLSSVVAAVHRQALDHFGPVAGELLAAAYLEHRAGRRFDPSG